jgi:hypothetical protein
VRCVFGEQSIWTGLTSWLLISCRDGYRWSSAARQGVVHEVEFGGKVGLLARPWRDVRRKVRSTPLSAALPHSAAALRRTSL